MKKQSCLLIFSLLLFSAIFGCAHSPHNLDSTESKTSNQNVVRVAMPPEEVNVGDQIEILKRTCSKHRPGPGDRGEHCKTEVVGYGKVMKKNSDKTINVELPDGFKLLPDMTFEKIKTR